MEMSESEIRMRYRQMKPDGQDRIDILAGLNACPLSVIRRIVGEADPLPDTEHAIDWGMARDLWDQGKTDREIASDLNCTIEHIPLWRAKFGLAANRKQKKRRIPMGRKKAEFNEIKARELFEAGATDRDMADILGVNVFAVAKWRRDCGLLRQKGHKPAPKPVPQEPTACRHENDVPSCDVCPDAPCDGSAPKRTAAEQAAMEKMAGYLADVGVTGCDGPEPVNETPSFSAERTKPVIIEPSFDELLADVDRLERQILFLRGIAIGAGVRDIDQLLEAM